MACLRGRGILPDYPKATDPVDIATLAGTYSNLDMPICQAQVRPVGPCLGVCFCLGPMPFAAACAGPSGPNCFTNYQGFYVTVVDENFLVSGYLCCNAVLKKQAPRDPRAVEEGAKDTDPGVTFTVEWSTAGRRNEGTEGPDGTEGNDVSESKEGKDGHESTEDLALQARDPTEEGVRTTLEQVLLTKGIELPASTECKFTVITPGSVFKLTLNGPGMDEPMMNSIQDGVTKDEADFKTTWALAFRNYTDCGDVTYIFSIEVVVNAGKTSDDNAANAVSEGADDALVEEEKPSQVEMEDVAKGAGEQEIGDNSGEAAASGLDAEVAIESPPSPMARQVETEDNAKGAGEQETGEKPSQAADYVLGDPDDETMITSI